MPLLYDMDMTEYGKMELNVFFGMCVKWFTQSVIGIPLRRMPNFINV